MRLTDRQAELILSTTNRVLGSAAQVMLFGSRVDDQAQGGDVDVYVEVPKTPGMWQKACLLAELEKELGLSVDLVVHGLDETERPIHRIAKLSGVTLSQIKLGITE